MWLFFINYNQCKRYARNSSVPTRPSSELTRDNTPIITIAIITFSAPRANIDAQIVCINIMCLLYRKFKLLQNTTWLGLKLGILSVQHYYARI